MARTILTLVPLVALALTGCAGQTESRRLAGQTAALLNDYRREVDAFAQRQTAMNADDDARVRSFDARTAALNADTELRLTGMKATEDKKALTLYQLYSARGLDQILGSSTALQSLTPAPPSAKVTFDSAPVQAVVKQLKALEEEPSLSERLGSAQAYYAALQAAYRESLKESGAKTDVAKDSGALASKPKDAAAAASKLTPAT